MKTKLKVLMLFMAFIYVCAILIAGTLNPLTWDISLRIFTVILLCISGLIILMLDSKELEHTKEYEPDYEWDAEVKAGR